MAEIIEKFRVDCNGVVQDAQVCYNHLANKPEFKTINGSKIFITSGDTETDLLLATNTQVNQAMAAAATAQSEVDNLTGTVSDLTDRVDVLEESGGGGGGGSSYDDTEVRELIAAETTRATQQELILTQQLNGTTETANSALSKANTCSEYIDYAESNHATKAEVNSKQDTLVSGTNIKTINGNSLLGSGDITITGSGDDVDLSNYYTKAQTDEKCEEASAAAISNIESTLENSYLTTTQINTALESKQATLVSGSNIKTINGNSLLGSGDITISGSGDIDLSNYVDLTSSQTITGNKTFTGNIDIRGKLYDRNIEAGTSGQILSSTGSGIAWIDAPETDLSNYYTKAYIDDFLGTLDERITALENIANAEEGTY